MNGTAVMRLSDRGTRSPILIAGLASLATAAIGFGVGFASLRGVTDPLAANASGLADQSIPEVFGYIVARNSGALLLLFSGVVTAGLSTLLALMMIGAFVGATLAAAAGSVGLSTAIGSILIYAPLEFAALLIAAVAGFLPVVNAVRPSPDASPGRRYLLAMPSSLRILLLAAITLIVAAFVESLVIVWWR